VGRISHVLWQINSHKTQLKELPGFAFNSATFARDAPRLPKPIASNMLLPCVRVVQQQQQQQHSVVKSMGAAKAARQKQQSSVA